LLEHGQVECFIPETRLTLDGLAKNGKIDLLALREVGHGFKKSKWDDYVQIGVRFLLCPRIGLPRPTYTDIQGNRVDYILENSARDHFFSQETRQKRYFKALRFIEGELGAGRDWLKSLQDEICAQGGTYQKGATWFENVANNIDQIGANNFSKRFGDWADADAVASHYAYGNYVFCTNDQGKGAGARSVLSSTNRQILERRLGLRFMTLEEVLEAY